MANLYEFLDHAETRIGVSEDQHSQYDWARFAELAKICEVVNESAGLTLWHCAQAFMFYTRDFRENMREPYFAPITSYTSEQGEVCEGPPWRDMPKEALDLYRDRVCRTSNEVARTRYADIVWEKERDYKMALIAYAGYLAQAENYEVKGWLRPTIEALGRAMEIALTLQEVGRVSETLVAIRGFVDRCHEAGTFETLPLLELVAGMKRRFLADDALEWATSRASEAAEHFSSVGGEALWSERSYLGVMVKVLRRQVIDSKNASRRIALSLKRHGLEHQSALIGSSHLRAAITAFQALGDRDEVATLLALFQEMSQRAGAEFGTIQSEISVPTEEVERYLGFFVERDNLARSLQLVSVHFQPNVETSRNQALELKKTSPLQFMIPNQTVSHDGRVVGNATTEEEIFEHQVMRQVRLGYHIGASFIAQIFGRLVDRGLDASSLTAGHVPSSGVIARRPHNSVSEMPLTEAPPPSGPRTERSPLALLPRR